MSPIHPDILPYTVALTGGIASGKSEVARCFTKHGIDILDADQITRELVQPGQPALDEIMAAFGKSIITASGSLDRSALRKLVFAEAAARLRLENILHPRVREELLARVAHVRSAYSLIVIPLLVEALHDYNWVNRILVVDTPENVQIERLIKRDGIPHELATKMVAAQVSRTKRLAAAADVIDNTGSPAFLDQQVDVLHQQYLELALAKS